jgi:hypothetical protein
VPPVIAAAAVTFTMPLMITGTVSPAEPLFMATPTALRHAAVAGSTEQISPDVCAENLTTCPLVTEAPHFIGIINACSGNGVSPTAHAENKSAINHSPFRTFLALPVRPDKVATSDARRNFDSFSFFNGLQPLTP